MSVRRNNFFKPFSKKELVCISFCLKNNIRENALEGRYKVRVNKNKIIFSHKYYLKNAGFKLSDTRFHTTISWGILQDNRKSIFYNTICAITKENDK